MAEGNKQATVTLTSEQLQELLLGMVREANKMNPLEEKKYQEDLAREKRRNLLAVELGRTEDEARWRRQHQCSHHRDGTSGEAVPRGKGVPTTSGQQHGDRSISLICMRCAMRWQFLPTAEEQQYLDNGGGLLNFPIPEMSRVINLNEFAAPPKPREVFV
jgi:hypothetical protein